MSPKTTTHHAYGYAKGLCYRVFMQQTLPVDLHSSRGETFRFRIFAAAIVAQPELSMLKMEFQVPMEYEGMAYLILSECGFGIDDIHQAYLDEYPARVSQDRPVIRTYIESYALLCEARAHAAASAVAIISDVKLGQDFGQENIRPVLIAEIISDLVKDLKAALVKEAWDALPWEPVAQENTTSTNAQPAYA